jgi:hypothetical protein
MRAIGSVLMTVLFLAILSRRRAHFSIIKGIVSEVLNLISGFCFTCSAFVVDVQAMVYHFCSLQTTLVHIVIALDGSLKIPATQTLL